MSAISMRANTDPDWNNAFSPKAFRKEVHSMLKEKLIITNNHLEGQYINKG